MTDSKFESQNRTQMVETTLDLLDAMEHGKAQSQRGLASQLGVALGLTNAMVKRCVRKGLVKVKQVPARRYAYYLTPDGFREKTRLTAEYLSVSLHFFRQARAEYGDAMAYCADRGWRRVVLYGVGELAEIAILAAREAGIELIGVIDPARNEADYCGLPVVRGVAAVGDGPSPFDAVIVTCANAPQRVFDALTKEMQAERVVTPPLLRVARMRVAQSGGRSRR